MNDIEHERHLENRLNQRMRADEKSAATYDMKATKARRLIGELCRDGRPVYYVYARGGKYREGGQYELVDFLIRNKYV